MFWLLILIVLLFDWLAGAKRKKPETFTVTLNATSDVEVEQATIRRPDGTVVNLIRVRPVGTEGAGRMTGGVPRLTGGTDEVVTSPD